MTDNDNTNASEAVQDDSEEAVSSTASQEMPPEAEVAVPSEDERASDEVPRLEAALAEAQAKADEHLDGWQRALADFANYKKRIERDRASFYQEAVGQVILRYLEILDDLGRALRDRPEEGDGATWAEGIALIYRKLQGYLESQGIQPVEAEGAFFDPNLHEAISQEESDQHESGQIIEVVQNGYRLGERVLRPARVRVAR